MDENSRMCLITNRQALEKDIKTSYIMDHMVADQVLTLQEEEKVKQQVESSPFIFSQMLMCFVAFLQRIISVSRP